MKVALIAGASGLIGQNCLSFLLETASYAQVVSLSRRRVNRDHEKLTQVVTDFDSLKNGASEFRAKIKGERVDDAFCCLGATIKSAGSRDGFRKVDFEYIVKFAELAQALGAKRLFLVSALGANPRSSLFYNAVKGETESAVRKLGLVHVYVFRPSLLLGERKEFRLAEKVATVISKPFSKLMVGPLRKFAPITARDVARAMVKVAEAANSNVGDGGHGSIFRVIESSDIQKIADGSF